MADLTEIRGVGHWRIVVIQRDAAYSQRVVVDPSAGGQIVVPGTPGTIAELPGDIGQWRLRIEHNDGTGWSNNALQPDAPITVGSRISRVIRSEDIPEGSGRDFNDLVIRLEKVGMVEIPVLPFGIWPATLQETPGGILEAALGAHYLAVRVRNIWTQPWPVGSRVQLSARCKAWLSAAGIRVVDAWSVAEQGTFGQRVAGGAVEVGSVAAWDERLVYFKVDVSNAAAARKYPIELQVVEPSAPDPDAIDRLARSTISVSRTTYDSAAQVFLADCDRGRITAAIRELVVEPDSYRRALGRALAVVSGAGGGAGRPVEGCSPADIERLRGRLRAFLEGKDSDICTLWRDLQCCCVGGKGEGDDDWSTHSGTGLEFFSWPTQIDYRVEYAAPFAGQFGPVPFDDPWWKVVLIVIAIILTIAAVASAASDLENRGSEVAIGVITGTILDAPSTMPSPAPLRTDRGSVDAAVATLNGSRSLTANVFSFLDAAPGEANPTPTTTTGRIDSTGDIVTNAELFTLLDTAMTDPTAMAALRVYRSSARTGVSFGTIARADANIPRNDSDGSTRIFLNQLRIIEDGTTPPNNKGDSGSLWLQVGTNRIVGHHHGGCPATNMAMASRIEDVIDVISIRFG